MTPAPPSSLALAKMIDHSLLHPTLTDAQLRAGLKVARDCACATACVQPCAVPLATELLEGSGVGICAVAGFPHGNSHPEIIVAEALRAISEGATEIDMVANAGKVLGGDWGSVTAGLKLVNEAITARGAILLRGRALGVTRIGATATEAILAEACAEACPVPFHPV